MPRAGKKAIARYVSHSNNGVLQEKETMPKKNILIGDDDQVILDILKEMIQREGYRVFLASNGKEAVETIKVNPIDLAILDIKMPFMDGIEALKEIKKIDQGIEVLIMTGYADLETLRQAINDHGAFDYILKPFKRDEILNGIQNALLKRNFSYQKKLREKELQGRILQLEKEFHERSHQLRESQIKYKDIVENSNDAIVVVQDGKLKFTNFKAVELTGYRQEELMAMSFLEMVHPEDRNMVEESYKREGLPSIFSFRASRKSGEPLFVESNAVRTTWEKRQATLNIIRDVTDRKHAEDALKASQDYIRNIIDSSLDMIIAVDMNRRIVEFNKAAERILGYRREVIAGTMVDILYADPNEGLEVHKTAVDNGQCTKEILNRRKNGEVFPSFLSASTLLDIHGNVQGVMGVSRDITEQKQAEKKLTASLKEKEVLLKEVHHRVKNNMQVISSMLSLQSHHTTDKASRTMFQESQNRIRAMALIHEKLYTSEDLAHIDIAAYIQDLTASLFSTYTVSNAIKVNTDITDIFLTITTAIPCGLIINELVTNALKHAFPHQQKGTITVSMTPSTKDHLILTVSDTGIGFPEGIDFRNTTTLGMQLVISLVEQLEGTITLDRSEGTRFRIEFRTQE
jgi:PAS domain S-box-containing protein